MVYKFTRLTRSVLVGLLFTRSVLVEDTIKANYAQVLSQLEENSVLKEQGYVDWHKLMAVYDAARWHEDGGSVLFAIFRLATAEVILQAAGSKLSKLVSF